MGEGISCVCVVGGVLEEGGNGKITYKEGSRKSMLVKEAMGVNEAMGVKEMRRMVTETIGYDLSEHKVSIA